jgi:hypothetical protein
VTRAERRRRARKKVPGQPTRFAVVDRKMRSFDEVLADPPYAFIFVPAGGATELLANPTVQIAFGAGYPVIIGFEDPKDHEFVAAVRDAAFAASPVVGSA